VPDDDPDPDKQSSQITGHRRSASGVTTPLTQSVAQADKKTRIPGWLRRVVLLVIAGICAVTIIRMVGRIDWATVGSALSELTGWHFAVLLTLVVVRQIFSALPLALFIERLTVVRAVLNDLGAILMSVIAPPPSDLVLRISMFRSWGINASSGIAGAVMNTMTFYIVRFSMPAMGAALMIFVAFQLTYVALAAVGLILAGLITFLLFAILHTEALAQRIGLQAGRAVRRFRSSIDPGRWAAACVQFRTDLLGTVKRGVPKALAGLTVMVVVDALVLFSALRFVGIGRADIGVIHVVGLFALVYPLTIFPLSGLGLLDAVVLAAVVDFAGLHVEPGVVAGLIVWRVMTLLVPMFMGACSIFWWRLRSAQLSRRST